MTQQVATQYSPHPPMPQVNGRHVTFALMCAFDMNIAMRLGALMALDETADQYKFQTHNKILQD